MSGEPIRIRIDTPTRTPEPGRGFYQLEEDALYVQIGPTTNEHSFFSSLESPAVHLECDKQGKLVFIEVTAPRRSWQVADPFLFPAAEGSADVRFLDFRQSISTPALLTDSRREQLEIRFGEERISSVIQIAEQVVIGISTANTLQSIWIAGITDDLAGQEIAAYRQSLKVGDK